MWQASSRFLVLSHISIYPCRNLHPKPRSVRGAAEEITLTLTRSAIVEMRQMACFVDLNSK